MAHGVHAPGPIRGRSGTWGACSRVGVLVHGPPFHAHRLTFVGGRCSSSPPPPLPSSQGGGWPGRRPAMTEEGPPPTPTNFAARRTGWGPPHPQPVPSHQPMAYVFQWRDKNATSVRQKRDKAVCRGFLTCWCAWVAFVLSQCPWCETGCRVSVVWCRGGGDLTVGHYWLVCSQCSPGPCLHSPPASGGTPDWSAGTARVEQSGGTVLSKTSPHPFPPS